MHVKDPFSNVLENKQFFPNIIIPMDIIVIIINLYEATKHIYILYHIREKIYIYASKSIKTVFCGNEHTYM